VTISPGNEARGLPAVQGVYLLLDGMTCQPLALLEGSALTLRRTACASALAVSYLARDDSRHLVMVGAGALAPHLVRAHASVRPIRRVTIWNRTQAKAVALAAALTEEGLEAQAAEDLKASVEQADVVSCATMSSEPVISGAWLRDGCHVDLVGAFKPSMREVDDAAIRRARVFVDTRSGALAEAGDIVLALASGALAEGDIRADLFDLCRGTEPGRRGTKEITLFKSVGSALEDLAAARLVVERTGA
jgi:alanine dehydrogenase